MDSEWALEVMHKASYLTVSFIDEDGKPYGLPLSQAGDGAQLRPDCRKIADAVCGEI